MDERNRNFPPTRWTQVEAAAQPPHSAQETALADLLQQYLPALKEYLLVQFRVDPAQADDLLQSFVLDKVLKAGLLSHADRQRGKFRTFLLNTLTNFVISEQRRATAGKRAPQHGSISLDLLPEEAAEIQLEQRVAAFDLAFARQLINEAANRMRAQCEGSNRPDIWGVFESRILSPILDDVKPLGYEELIARFGFQSPAQASNVLITAKRMFVRMLRSVVAEFVEGEENIDAEIDELRAILAGA
jgi:RNA polymerase sigma-70 factor (ECF subfamily)